MDYFEFDALSIAPLQKKKKKKKKKKESCGKKVGPNLLSLVRLLGLDKGKVVGKDSLTYYF